MNQVSNIPYVVTRNYQVILLRHSGRLLIRLVRFKLQFKIRNPMRFNFYINVQIHRVLPKMSPLITIVNQSMLCANLEVCK